MSVDARQRDGASGQRPWRGGGGGRAWCDRGGGTRSHLLGLVFKSSVEYECLTLGATLGLVSRGVVATPHPHDLDLVPRADEALVEGRHLHLRARGHRVQHRRLSRHGRRGSCTSGLGRSSGARALVLRRGGALGGHPFGAIPCRTWAHTLFVDDGLSTVELHAHSALALAAVIRADHLAREEGRGQPDAIGATCLDGRIGFEARHELVRGRRCSRPHICESCRNAFTCGADLHNPRRSEDIIDNVVADGAFLIAAGGGAHLNLLADAGHVAARRKRCRACQPACRDFARGNRNALSFPPFSEGNVSSQNWKGWGRWEGECILVRRRLESRRVVDIMNVGFSALVVGIAVARASSDATTLRVATYNTDCRVCDLPHDHGRSWKVRAERERAVLAEINADIIFIEEPVFDKDARMVLPTDRNWTVLQESGTLIEDPDATLAVDANKFLVEKSGWKWLGPHPSRPGGFDIFTLPRLVVWAQLRARATGATFVAMATHFDHGDGTGKSTGPSSTNCVQSAREIAALLHNDTDLANRPVLFGGDLNSRPTSNAYHTLLNTTTLRDTWFAAGINHTVYANTSAAAAAYNFTIDHIMASPEFRVLHAGASVRTWAIKKGGKEAPPSDHFPVFADVSLSS